MNRGCTHYTEIRQLQAEGYAGHQSITRDYNINHLIGLLANPDYPALCRELEKECPTPYLVMVAAVVDRPQIHVGATEKEVSEWLEKEFNLNLADAITEDKYLYTLEDHLDEIPMLVFYNDGHTKRYITIWEFWYLDEEDQEVVRGGSCDDRLEKW